MSDKFSTVEQQASYGVGRQMVEQLAANSFEGVDIAAVQAGLADAFSGVDSAVSMQDLQVAFTEISRRIQS
ncbi:MAG: FKBP-type peptidyl-prolyl cis-trans isomerase N-terminal domain-containing protein, partial [Shewanella sp.]